jgi:transposase
MMGRLKSDQGQLFYEFHLGDAVPEDHLVRRIDAGLDLSWLRNELAPHYSSMGRPSVDPELMIRMLVVGYVFAIRSERLICREVQVNLAYRWFCKLGIEDAIPDHSAFSRARNEPSATERFSAACSNGLSRPVLRPVWLVAKALPLMRA